MPSPDIDAFFAAARKVCLSADETTRAWSALQASVTSHPHLKPAEELECRFELLSFMQDYPVRVAIPAPESAPLSLWTGANLFGYVQPFPA